MVDRLLHGAARVPAWPPLVRWGLARPWAVARLAVILGVGVLLLGPELLGGSSPPVLSGPLLQAVGKPSAVRNVGGKGKNDGSLTVSWRAPASNGGRQLTGYGVRWRRDGDIHRSNQLAVVDRHTHNYTFTGLFLGRRYWVSVHACNGRDSCGQWSDEVYVDMPAAPTPVPGTPTPGPPGAVRNVRIRDVTDTSFRVKWDAPTSNGGRALTGYGIQRRPGSITSVGANTEELTYRNLATRRYEVRVQACNYKNSCGPWSGWKSVTLPAPTPRPTATPRRTTPVFTKPGAVRNVRFREVTATSFKVKWDAPSDNGGRALTGYGILHRPAGAGWPGDEHAAVVDEHTEERTYSGLAPGRHGIRIRACNGRGSCGPWSNDRYVTLPDDPTPTPTATPTPIREPVISTPGPPIGPLPPSDPDCPRTPTAPTGWGAPQNLDVVPMPRRMAALCWTPIDIAMSYVIEATNNPTEPRQHNWITVTGSPSTPKKIIDLDKFYGGNGLAHNDGMYGLRVKAIQGTTHSPYSDIIIIIDTPIKSANGASSTGSEAKIHWNPLSRIQAFGAAYGAGSATFRVRKFEGNHDTASWRPDKFDLVLPIATASTNPHPFTGLTKHALYAIQYIYQPPPTPNASRKVFAARDVYVWPSDSRAGDQYVAGMGVRPRLHQKTYSYYICAETFDVTGRKSDWLTLVERAFTAWDTATDNLVTTVRVTPTPRPPGVTRPPGVADSGCGDRLKLTDDIVDKVRQTIMSSTPTGTPTRTPTPGEYIAMAKPNVISVLIQLQLGTGITQFQSRANKINEVLLYNDMDPSLADFEAAAVFRELSGVIGYGAGCWHDNGVWNPGVLACASGPDTITGAGSSVDVLIRHAPFATPPLGIPAGTVRFNTCRSIGPRNTPSAYESVLHEAGHALGIRDHDKSHMDSVMNYNFQEPDCSPHPLDILAIYALYQVPPPPPSPSPGQLP